MSRSIAGIGWNNGWRPMCVLLGYKWATCVYFQDGARLATRRILSKSLVIRESDAKVMAKSFLKRRAPMTKSAKLLLRRIANE